jgi:hypothetical protein
MSESHKQETAELRKGTDAQGSKFDRMNEMVTEMIKDYGQIKQALRECEVSYRQLENKLRQVNQEKRKNNIIIFALQEQRKESYFETLDTVVKWVRETMKIEVNNENIDYVTRLGKRKGERPILVKFIPFSKKLVVLKSKRNFWDMTPCSSLSFNRRFRGTYRLHVQGRRNRFSNPWQLETITPY